ncbi:MULTISPECIES: heavy metal-responsive transcriptional regulator [Planktothrix]|jgi:DNA-binding transcriptional MerR regulator|uniref:MerR family transcriptional regulator n=2 Tax=Planktothrix TaxID=54304 RepID=A0A4P5ZV59_PLAAG|nr:MULTISPECIES: heavy metal-responsive transcriptional regulator [Planktothrix]CAD5958732.1 Mercuric resistance operon regulatory protein [Planktothrix rubescens]MCB8764620.1 heavy metal-responsive transcriptional regulator [Planktothrix agardhii 1809]MCB8766302.1 heavy metal-responsive transcriptional regulator [Planktothrix agardhii 1809]MCB8782678.1 heavy metal-responsive transcriptional regulator [Planktothrix agardhii 1808]MCF3566294.1 heavy metal-responsive transcriptional regulator [Pl
MDAVIADERLKIGDVAQQSGLSVKTVRYYEEIGLLAPTVERSDSGYRLFEPSVINRLGFVRRAQSLGLSLNEIRDILKVSDRGELPCEEVKQHLALKVEEINHQITALEILKTELQQLLNHWQDHPLSVQVNTKICPNIQGEPP